MTDALYTLDAIDRAVDEARALALVLKQYARAGDLRPDLIVPSFDVLVERIEMAGRLANELHRMAQGVADET